MNYKSITAGFFAVLIWSIIPALVKVGSSSETLSFFLFGRFIIASILFLPFLKEILTKMKQIPKTKWLLLATVLGGNFYFQGLAMEAVPTSWYLVVFSLNPILTLLFIGSNWNKSLIMALVICIFGSFLFLKSSEFKVEQNMLVLLYMFLGMLTWVLYTVIIKGFQKIYNDTETTGITQFLSLISVTAIWFYQGFPVKDLNLTEVSSVIILGLTTPLAYFLFSYTLRHTPKFGIISQYLEPMFGVVIGAVFFNEPLTLASIVGAIAIVAGAVRVERG